MTYEIHTRDSDGNGSVWTLSWVHSRSELNFSRGERVATEMDLLDINSSRHDELMKQREKAIESLRVEDKYRDAQTIAGLMFCLRVRYECNLRALNKRDGKETIEGIRYLVRGALGDDAKGLAYSSTNETLICELINKVQRLERENEDLRKMRLRESEAIATEVSR